MAMLYSQEFRREGGGFSEPRAAFGSSILGPGDTSRCRISRSCWGVW